MSYRRCRSERVQLITSFEARSALGTITSAPCVVFTLDDRMPMRWISPVSGADLDQVADADRALDDENQAGHEVVDDVLQPKPMPTPSAPAISVTFVMSMPSAASASTVPTMIMIQRVNVAMA